MSKTKDLGHLAHLITYDSSGNITLPANLTVTGTLTGYATTASLGSYAPTSRTITINGTSYDLSADRSWTITSMIYPSAGIPLSTGAGWGTSITNNSANWNTAYGWGNHASAGYLTSINSSQVTTALGFTPASSSHQHDTLYYSGSARLWTGSDGTRNSGWAYHQDNGTGIHWPNNGWHLYPKNASDFYVRSGSSDASIQFMRSGTTANYIHNASDNAIGFLSTGRSWILRVTDGGDAYTTSTHYAAGYRGSANVGGTGEATWHPAGIYCGGTMWQYGTQYRNGNTTSGQGWTYLDWNYGHSIVGVYASTRFQGVWAMGDSYKLPADGTSTGSLYGLAWSHPNAGGQAGYLDNHGLLVILNGTTYSAISNSIWARGNVTAYSDIRVKENIEIIENAMDKINSIRGVTFTRNDLPNTKRRHAGVIAQEIQKVLPEVIEENQSNGHLSVAYGNIVGLTIEGLKEHDIIIKKQAEEIKQLKEIIYGLTK